MASRLTTGMLRARESIGPRTLAARQLVAELVSPAMPSRSASKESEWATAEDVRWCYRLLLGRPPDEPGLRGYLYNLARRPIPVEELVHGFVSSEEFRDRLHRAFAWSDGAPEPVDLAAGYRLFVRPDDDTVGATIRRQRDYESHVSARVTAALSPGSVFVDVGASVGYFTVLAGRLVGAGGSVVACEPGPQNHSVLLLNVVANQLANVEIHHLAVSDEEGVVVYSHSGGNGVINPYPGEPSALGVNDLVKARPLDALLAGRPRVDAIKIDVEGAEGRVVRGALDTLDRHRPVLFFEFSPPALVRTSQMEGGELLELLAGLGYGFEVLREDGRDGPTSGPSEVLEQFSATDADHVDVMARPS